MPAALLTFARRRSRPTDRLGKSRARSALSLPPAPRGTGGQAPVGAGPDQPRQASITRSTWITPHGAAFPGKQRSCHPPGMPDTERRRGRLQGLSPCKEPGPLGRFLRRSRGRCPHGLLLFRALWRCAVDDRFSVVFPSRAPCNQVPRMTTGRLPAPQGLAHAYLEAPLARCLGPPEVFHLFNRPRGSAGRSSLAAADGFSGALASNRPIRFPSNLGFALPRPSRPSSG